MKSRCLIVDELHHSIGPLLEGIKVDYDYLPNISRAEIKEILADYEGLIIRSKTNVDEDLIENSNLKYVARAGAGIDNIDQQALKNRNILLINAPEGNRDSVGEHTVGMMLNILHNLTKSHNEIIDKQWNREANRGSELGALTVGIIGYGNTGSSVAKRLSGFGCTVLAYDKYLKELPDQNAHLVTIDELFHKSDILSLHIPLTEETVGLINAAFLTKFKKPIILINTSRGEIAKLKEISAGLASGKIKYAALDVLECEKIKDMSPDQLQAFDYIKESGKVLFTPHVAGWTFESYEKINVVLVEKIGSFLELGNT